MKRLLRALFFVSVFPLADVPMHKLALAIYVSCWLINLVFFVRDTAAAVLYAVCWVPYKKLKREYHVMSAIVMSSRFEPRYKPMTYEQVEQHQKMMRYAKHRRDLCLEGAVVFGAFRGILREEAYDEVASSLMGRVLPFCRKMIDDDAQ